VLAERVLVKSAFVFILLAKDWFAKRVTVLSVIAMMLLTTKELKNSLSTIAVFVIIELTSILDVLSVRGGVERAGRPKRREPLPRMIPFTSRVTPGALQFTPRRLLMESK
jgi:hypothetical protein